MRQAQTDAAIQEVLPTSLRVGILYLANYFVFLGMQEKDHFMIQCHVTNTGLIFKTMGRAQ